MEDTNEQERAAFFAWVDEQGCDTDGAWSAWLGRAALSEWRPIETAPENTPILTYAEWAEPEQYGVSLFRYVEVVREEVESESHNSKGRRRIIQERSEMAREWSGAHWEPTHWMPLPPPPVAAQPKREVK